MNYVHYKKKKKKHLNNNYSSYVGIKKKKKNSGIKHFDFSYLGRRILQLLGVSIAGSYYLVIYEYLGSIPYNRKST